jgi:hypothetical protein
MEMSNTRQAVLEKQLQDAKNDLETVQIQREGAVIAGAQAQFITDANDRAIQEQRITDQRVTIDAKIAKLNGLIAQLEQEIVGAKELSDAIMSKVKVPVDGGPKQKDDWIKANPGRNPNEWPGPRQPNITDMLKFVAPRFNERMHYRSVFSKLTTYAERCNMTHNDIKMCLKSLLQGADYELLDIQFNKPLGEILQFFLNRQPSDLTAKEATFQMAQFARQPNESIIAAMERYVVYFEAAAPLRHKKESVSNSEMTRLILNNIGPKTYVATTTYIKNCIELHQRTLSWEEILDFVFKTEDGLQEYVRNQWIAAPVTTAPLTHNIYINTGDVAADTFSLGQSINPQDPHQAKAIRASNNPVPMETQMNNMRKYAEQMRANSRERKIAEQRLRAETNEQQAAGQMSMSLPQPVPSQLPQPVPSQLPRTQDQSTMDTSSSQQNGTPSQQGQFYNRSPGRYQQRSESPRRFGNQQYNPGGSERMSRNDQWQQQTQQFQQPQQAQGFNFQQQQMPQSFNFQNMQSGQTQQGNQTGQVYNPTPQPQYNLAYQNSRQPQQQQNNASNQQSGQSSYQQRDSSRNRQWYGNSFGQNQQGFQPRSRNSSPGQYSPSRRQLIPGQHVRPGFDANIHKECIKCPSVLNVDGTWNRETSHNDATCITYVFYNRLGCHLCKKLNLGDAFHLPAYCKNWGNVTVKDMDITPYQPINQGN